MVVINDFGKWFGGDNFRSTKSTKSTNTAKQAFIDPDADIIEATVLKSERQPFTDIQNSQNNPGRRNPEDSFSAKKNFDFSESVPFSRVAQASVSNGFPMPSRLLSGNDSRGSLSPFRSSNRELARELANA